MMKRLGGVVIWAFLVVVASGPTMPPGPWDEKPLSTSAKSIDMPSCFPCGRAR